METYVYPPVLQRCYTCEDVFDLTIGQIAVSALCCPCVYGAGFQRMQEDPMQIQALCPQKRSFWWIGCCCPPCAGAIVRREYAENPRPSCCVGLIHETICCCWTCAPCAMDEFRQYDSQINMLLHNSVDPDIFDDGSVYT